MLFHLLAGGLSVLIALLRGGSIRNIPHLVRLWLPPVAVALQLSTSLFPGTVAAMATMILSYGLLVWFVLSNWQFVGLRVLVVGLGLNLVVIASNGGRMPTSVETTRQVGIPDQYVSQLVADQTPKHTVLTSESRLAVLGDIIPVKYPLPRVLSIGDMFILLGAFLFVQEGMGKRVLLFGSGES